MADPGVLERSTWVVVAPSGVVYVGLHTDEADTWQTCLGWPSEQEIQYHREAGWYAAPATITWKRPTPDSESGA